MTDNEIKGIIDILEEAVKNEVQEQIEPDWNYLQAAAKKFLQWYSAFEVSKIQMQKQKQIIAMNDISGYNNFSSDIIKAAQTSKSFYRSIFEFDEALARYLGQVPKRGIYVFFDVDGRPSTYEMSMENLANISQGRGRIGKLGIKNLHSIESQIDANAKEDLEHINRGACAVMGINNRLNRFYENRGKQTVVNKKTGESKERNAQRQSGLLMWKINGEWKIATITNQGIIGEAYASFLMTKHNAKNDYLAGVNTGTPKYYSDTLIDKFYHGYLFNITNEAAIVEEDIYTDWAQYAVKIGKAALPSPDQFIRTAYTVLSSSTEISPKYLKKMVSDAFHKDSKLAPFIGSFLDDAVDDKLKELLNSSGFLKANTSAMYKFLI